MRRVNFKPPSGSWNVPDPQGADQLSSSLNQTPRAKARGSRQNFPIASKTSDAQVPSSDSRISRLRTPFEFAAGSRDDTTSISSKPPTGLQRENKTKTVKKIIEAIEQEEKERGWEDGDFSAGKLMNHSFEVKEEVVNYLLGTVFFFRKNLLMSIFKNIHLGDGKDASLLRQKIISEVGNLRGLSYLSREITNFLPTENDIPFLVELGKKLAKIDLLEFPSYLASIQGTPQEDDDRVRNPDYKVLKLSVNDNLDLINSWAVHFPWQWNQAFDSSHTAVSALYKNIEKNLGNDGLLACGSAKIPAFLREIGNRWIDPLKKDDPVSIWLGYSAAHLLDKQFSVSTQRVLTRTYSSLLQIPDEKLRYACSSIIGRAMQNEHDVLALFETLRHFDDATLAVLFYAAVKEDTALSVRFASVLNLKTVSDSRLLNETALSFVNFADSTTISSLTKQHILQICADALSESEDALNACIDMMDCLGRIGHTIEQKRDARLGQLYEWWLPGCKNVGQLIDAIYPDKEFLASLIEMQLTAKEEEVNALIASLGAEQTSYVPAAIEVKPLVFSEVELLAWVKNAVGHWIKTDHLEELVSNANYLADEVLPHSRNDQGLLDNKRVADHCPYLEVYSTQSKAQQNVPLFNWTQVTAMLMLTVERPLIDLAFVKEAIDNIAKFRGENIRVAVTACLHQGLRDHDTAAALANFAVGFQLEHTKIFTAPLFVLSNDGQFERELGPLIKLIQHRRFRDTKKALPLLTFVVDMALNKSLSSHEKCHILKALTEQDNKIKNGVSLEMIYVSGLARLADAGTEESSQAIAALKTIVDHRDAIAAGKTLLKIIFSIAEQDTDTFIQDYERYMQRSRNPTALLAYATSMYLGIDDLEEHEEVMGEISLLGQLLVADNDKDAFNRIRYAATDNAHMTLLKEKAPLAIEIWKEPMQWEVEIQYEPADLDIRVDPVTYLRERIVEDRHVDAETFPLLESALTGRISVEKALSSLDDYEDSKFKNVERQLLLAVVPGISKLETAKLLANLPNELPSPQLARDIQDLRRQLVSAPLSLEKCRNLRASISSDAEDLLLIGTDVIGSCQSIYSEPELAKALPGYVLDGKYLSAQVSNETGLLMSRRMLRLLWSEQHDQPVIYVEREYCNPGVPQKIKDACLELIRIKARKMGALLATEDEKLASQTRPEIGTLHSYRTPRPHEYVDALGGIQNYGIYSIAGAHAMKTSDEIMMENFEQAHYRKMLGLARDHVGMLKKLKVDNQSPRDFIRGTRDDYGSELMIGEIVAAENERNPGLNLSICRSSEVFASKIAKLAKTGKTLKSARYLTTVRARGLWHVVGYEATVVWPGKIYIRGFDSLPQSRSQHYFDAVSKDLASVADEKNIEIKMETFATAQQQSPAGCDIFSLSFVLKSLDDRFDGSDIDFDESKSFDSQLIADDNATRLSIPFYKHAQRAEVIDQIVDNPIHAEFIDEPVNKKNQTLAQRFDANTTTQEVSSLSTRQQQAKTFSDSIDAKRIVFYERLIQRLRDKLLHCQETF